MAMILDAFVSKLSETIVGMVQDEVGMLLGVAGEIEKLGRTLRRINKVLADADRKRVVNDAIDDWVKELKDIMYDADDILDHCRIEAEKQRAASSSVRTRFSLISLFRKASFTHEIGSRVKELNDKLEEFSKSKSSFDLKLGGSDHRVVRISRRTSSVLVDSDIVGDQIIAGANNLVELLIREDKRENLLVLAVIGAGGIGKTTLAQKVFDDQKVKDEFSVTMWVCVSQEFSEVDLLKGILSSSGIARGGACSRAELELMVRDAVRGRKFLVVLDDVWDYQVWDGLLRSPLMSGAAGSRILVTTRNESVARQMKAVHIHKVALLPAEDGWSLLCKKVVLRGEEESIRGLKDIGMQIVNKCGHLPLAIKTIGGVLCSKGMNRRAWEGVLQSTAWSLHVLHAEVNAALYLSYEDLPSPLKQCFLYCAVLPNYSYIDRTEIVQCWIAEGFIEVEGDLSMEDLGEEYFRELVWRNLLQPVPKFYDQRICKMHGLLHSMVQFLTRDESLAVRQMLRLDAKMAPMKLRRLSIACREIFVIPKELTTQESLRTLLLYTPAIANLHKIFNHFSRVRVLELKKTSIKELPASLGDLIHLRYLNLTGTNITSIPESIQKLRNLQFLNVEGCKNLCVLPKGIVKVQNLRSLNLLRTKVEGMPVGLANLRHLNTLQGFTLHGSSSEEWCTLKELRDLSQLRHLTLGKLEKASGGAEASRAELESKLSLRVISLHCTMDRVSDEDVVRIEEVFERLRPPSCIERLHLGNYFGHEFPSWMKVVAFSSSHLSNLRRLDLENCCNCKQLPPLGHLPNLDYLWINKAIAVRSIGHDLSCGTSPSSYFPKLETLVFMQMPNWEGWLWESRLRAMPSLTILKLIQCPKLRSLPEGLLYHSTKLTCLKILNVDSLREVNNLISLKELHIHQNPNLEKVTNLPALKSFTVKKCPALKVVENLHASVTLKLDIYGMNSLPAWISDKFMKVELRQCDEKLFMKICHMDDGPERDKIRNIPRVIVSSRDGSRFTLTNPTSFSM